MGKNIQNHINNFLDGKASKKDMEQLNAFESFAEGKVNHSVFKDTWEKNRIKRHIYKNITKHINIPVRRIHQSNWIKYAAAAAVLLIATLTILLIQNSKFRIQNLEPIIVNNQIAPGTEKATLTLEDGKVVTLEKGNTYQTPNATSNGEEIIYQPQSSRAPAYQTDRQSRDIAYNTLTIPRGGQYNMVLADGTKVWLNSESQIRYPVAFTEGETRQVELIYGEAYFDVSPSTQHGGASFKVLSSRQSEARATRDLTQIVEVLGTEFNIKAYKDETNIYTTLVEGKVSVSTAADQQILMPNEQSSIDLKTNNINITTVDYYREVSWKNGVFSFSKMRLKDIMKVLSRWYDMEVIFEDKHLEDVIFTGTLGKDQGIEDILSALKSTNYIMNYQINNKTLTIK